MIDINSPVGYEQIVANGLVRYLNVPAGAKRAILQVEVGGWRYRDDGPAPSSTVGMLIDSPLPYTGNLKALALLETAPGSILNVAYYG